MPSSGPDMRLPEEKGLDGEDTERYETDVEGALHALFCQMRTRCNAAVDTGFFSLNSKGSSCFCRPVYQVSSAPKERDTPDIPDYVVQKAAESKVASGRQGAADECGTVKIHGSSRCSESTKITEEFQSSKASCCSKTPSVRDSHADEKVYKSEPQTTAQSCCSSNQSTRKRLSATKDSEESENLQDDLTPKPSPEASPTRPVAKRNRTTPLEMPSRTSQNTPEPRDPSGYKAEITTPASTAMHSIPSLPRAPGEPLIVGAHLMRLSEKNAAPSNPPLAAPKATLPNLPTWVGSEHCHCGDNCQCLGCETHPYNQATVEAVQAMGDMMFSSQNQSPQEFDTPSIAASGVTDYSQYPYDMPSYSAYPQSSLLNESFGSPDGNPYYMHHAPVSYEFDPNFVAGVDCTNPAGYNDFAATTTSDTACPPYDAQNGYHVTNPGGIVMVPNAYWQLEYPLPFSNPCTNSLGNCKCGENCACVGCITHAGHDGVPVSLPTNMESTAESMQQQFALANFNYGIMPTGIVHETATSVPGGNGLVGLGLTVPGMMQASGIAGHCSTDNTDYVDSPPHRATISRG
ncbi:hypothetical protein KEM56_000924 [Ascosphaera pollenicola]|nr:hypothetical protein KEM56_000924 [Ascosphaera pollenicola]